MNMRSRKPVGDENVLSHVIPKQEPTNGIHSYRIKPSFLRVQVTKSLADKVRNIAVHDRITLTEFLGTAIAEKVESLEEKRGAPYPRREREMQAGRPVQI